MKNTTKKYTNGEVTVVWQQDVCIHSSFCWKGLVEVFNPHKRPWIDVDGASTERIIEQVKKCPSGALSFYLNKEEKIAGGETSVETETIVEVSPNGPLMVYGNVSVKDAHGNVKKHSKVTSLCRCGGSENKPYCDGTHRKIDFRG